MKNLLEFFEKKIPNSPKFLLTKKIQNIPLKKFLATPQRDSWDRFLGLPGVPYLTLGLSYPTIGGAIETNSWIFS